MTPRTPKLLAVFAHPDDESLACGGLLSRCADEGIETSLLCLTRGEAGPGDALEGALGEVRAAELDAAARVLGVAAVELLDHEDGMLSWIDPARLEADILRTIRRGGPDVVVTFDEDGLYWHPDHVAVHERTTAVVSRLGDDAPALRYASLPAGAMRAVAELYGPGSILGVEDADAFGAMAPPPDLIVDAGPFAVRKLMALRCHRSQVAGGPLDRIDDGCAAGLLGTEHFRRAAVGSRAECFLDRFGASLGAPA